MKFVPTEIPGVIIVEPDVFGDHRGFFMESWHVEKFAEAGIDAQFVQDNHSRSNQGILRGLHYQIEQPQGKLVRVLSGEVFDVAEQADFFYKCTEFYAPEHERAIRWDDPDLAIDWPIASGQEPVLAPKDAAAKSFEDAEVYEGKMG